MNEEPNSPDSSVRSPMALVTASTDGIGRAVACALVRRGYALLVNGRHPETVESTVLQLMEEAPKGVEKPWIKGVVADLTDEAATDRIFEALSNGGGKLKAAFINTPTPALGAPERLDDEMWNYAIRALIRLPDALIRRVAEVMARNGGGAIVLNNSCSATVPIESDFYLANTLRPVSVAQAKAYARNYIRHGVRINILLTGFVDTTLTRRLSRTLAAERQQNAEELWNEWEESIPIGRLGTPDEIAQVAAFLLSNDSSYIVGAALEVDGGLSMQHQNF